MQVSVEHLGKLERKLTVKIPAENLDSSVAERVARMGREARLKGFRPGKVPRSVIEKRFGAQIRGEALSELIRSSFGQAVDQERLKPVAAPAINTTGQPIDGEIAYTATFEVMPELPEVDVGALSITRPVAEVGDADIDAMIETLRKQRRTYATVDRAAASDDMVLFQFSAQTGDERFPETGTERVGVVIGSGNLDAAIEQALIGQKAGDEVELETTFADGFKIEQLAGKVARIAAKVIRVQEPRLPEYNEAFIKGFGIGDGDVATFRQEVRRNLERELNTALMARLKGEVATRLASTHADIDVPRVMVVNEARNMAGIDIKARLPTERFNALQPVARRRVIAALLFGDIARRNEMHADQGRVAQALATLASTYEEPEQVVELYQGDPQLMDGLRTRVLEEQVAEWVAGHATCKDKQMTFDEVLRPDVAGSAA